MIYVFHFLIMIKGFISLFKKIHISKPKSLLFNTSCFQLLLVFSISWPMNYSIDTIEKVQQEVCFSYGTFLYIQGEGFHSGVACYFIRLSVVM